MKRPCSISVLQIKEDAGASELGRYCTKCFTDISAASSEAETGTEHELRFQLPLSLCHLKNSLVNSSKSKLFTIS
jgi:hypothetical protein